MAKLVKFDNFSDALFSFSEFKHDENGTNTKEYNKVLSILRKVIANELTERQRTCLEMYYKRKMNTIKIAEKLGIYPSTAWRHIQKSKERIKNIMKYYYMP